MKTPNTNFWGIFGLASFIIFPPFKLSSRHIISPQHVFTPNISSSSLRRFPEILILFINFGRLKSGNKSQAAKPKKRNKEKKRINEAINYRFCLEVEGVLCCCFFFNFLASLLFCLEPFQREFWLQKF